MLVWWRVPKTLGVDLCFYMDSRDPWDENHHLSPFGKICLELFPSILLKSEVLQLLWVLSYNIASKGVPDVFLLLGVLVLLGMEFRKCHWKCFTVSYLIQVRWLQS